MKHPKRIRERRDLCADLHEDDGLDARRNARSEARTNRSFTIADLRLCKAAHTAISHALLSLASDPFLAQLHAHSVSFERGRLVVVLAPVHPLSEPELDCARARAEAVRGVMRAAIAHAIVRKRTPDITIDISPYPLDSGVTDE